MAGTWTRLGARSVRAVQASTESAPTNSSSEGVDLNDVACVCLALSAPAGQAFTGTGTLLAYTQSGAGTTWMRAPRADVLLDDATGLAEVELRSIPVTSPVGRFQLVPNAVGLTGGALVTTDYRCVTSRGDAA